jgi:mannonate dehydratase
MNLVEFVPPTPHPLWELCPQMGITDVIVKVNPDMTGLPDPWLYETLSRIVYRLKDAGLNVVGLEGDPFDMSPIKEYGVGGELSRAEAQRRREEAIGRYRELLESMGKLGIKLLCYNFMVGKGWSRTGVREGRGGARATYFSLREQAPKVSEGFAAASPIQNAGALAKALDKSELKISHDQVWANFEYFVKAVMPTAEKCGVRMGLHPDDPCLPSLGGYARIFGSVEAYDRAYALYPSPSNAVTFCQANFKLMGVDLNATARHFGKRIAFIHVRDVDGTKEDFTELFHDQGTTDQFALMRTYRELGLDVPLRGDHVPEMAYDRVLTPEGTPGYFTLGRLFANGYLKALLKGTSNA